MKQLLPVIEAHTFVAGDLIAGEPALDFANTVTGRDERPRDWLDSYLRLLDWAELARLFAPARLAALRRAARAQPSRAANALAAAKGMRETVFELFSSLARGRTPRVSLLDELWSSALRGGALHRLGIRRGAIAIEPREEIDLDLVTGAIALRAVRLGSDLSSRRLRICEGQNCGWLFLDTSKAGRRRWCDMATCGNVAKARRHAERKASRGRPDARAR